MSRWAKGGIIVSALAAAVVCLIIHSNYANAGVGTGGDGVESDHCSSSTCWSGETFVYYGGSYSGCEGYDGIAQLEWCYKSDHMPTGVPKNLSDQFHYYSTGGLFSSWSEAESTWRSYGGSGSLKSQSGSYFCYGPDPGGYDQPDDDDYDDDDPWDPDPWDPDPDPDPDPPQPDYWYITYDANGGMMGGQDMINHGLESSCYGDCQWALQTNDVWTSPGIAQWTISSIVPGRDGYIFTGWQLSTGSPWCSYVESTLRSGGETITGSSNIVLCAAWEEATKEAEFSASSSGIVNAHEKLTRTDSNTVGKIENQTFNSTTGKYSWSWPSDSSYSATFTHNIKRTDSESGLSPATSVPYKIQYSLDNGNWTDVKSGTVSVAYNDSTDVTSSPSWTLNYSNRGKYIKYCQRVVYKKKIAYRKNNGSWGVDSYGDEGSTSGACIILKNPDWSEPTTTSDHYIDVYGSTITPTLAASMISGVRSVGTNQYETVALKSTFTYNHKLWREDSGFDVSGGKVPGTSINLRLYGQPSIYNNNNYVVTSKFNGYERISGKSTKSLPPVGANTPLRDALSIQFGSSGFTAKPSWQSSASQGRTSTTFDANPSSYYAILAGQTKTFCHTTYNQPARWSVGYTHYYRREVYYAPWASMTSAPFYVRTELTSTTPQDTRNPIYRDSTCTNISLYRPYHYKVTDITPSSQSGTTTYYGQEYGRNFDIEIQRPTSTYDYITDLRDHKAYVITYKIPAGVDPDLSRINGALLGGTTGYSGNAVNDVCNGFYGSKGLGIYGCQVVETGTITPKTANTTYNYVYNNNKYSLSYRTGSIKVPEMNLGDKFCIALAISRYASNNDGWFISKSACSNTSKRPTVQILGGDARSNGVINGSNTIYNNKNYGSWSETSIASLGKVNKFASGSAMAGGAATAEICRNSPLTIANEQCKSNPLVDTVGEASIPIVKNASTLIDTMQSYYLFATVRDASGCDTVSCLIETDHITAATFSSRGLRAANNFLTSKPLIFYSVGSITIDTDIILEPNRVYNDGLTPQVIIIAEQDVRVANNVTRVDAWIFAGRKFMSCVESGENRVNLSADICQNQLVVKGAISAGSIDLSRTFGGDPNAAKTVTTPSEKIYYSPMTLIYAAREAKRDAEPQTTYLRKMPPRY